MGRPPVYAPQVWEEVLLQISRGEFVYVIADQPGMPSVSGIKHKVENDPAFAADYARAREAQSHAHAERGVMAARNATPETAQAARLQFDAERWMAGKLAPRTYGDRIQQDVQVNGTLDVNELKKESKEQLLERLRVLEAETPGAQYGAEAEAVGEACKGERSPL